MLRKRLISSLLRQQQSQIISRPLLSSSAAFSTTSTSNATAKAPSPNDAFASGTNAYYAEEMYKRWHADSSSVHASWDVYFSGLEHGLSSSQAFAPPPGLIDVPSAVDGAPSLDVGKGSTDLTDHLKVFYSLTSILLFSY